MDTKKKAIIVSAILIGVGGYYIYKNMKMKSTESTSADGVATDTFDINKVLSKGSKGDEVKSLQAVTGKTSISIKEYNTFMANKSKK
jgi:putative Mn2+ efflux pump MntP